jgi:hypothetical protein
MSTQALHDLRIHKEFKYDMHKLIDDISKTCYGLQPLKAGPAHATREVRMTMTLETDLPIRSAPFAHETARTFSARIGDFERIERMLTAAEVRRNGALRELDRYRASFALRLRRAVQAAEDASLAVVAPAPPAREDAA